MASTSERPSPPAAQTILLVEDDPGVAEITAAQLQVSGYAVRTVSSAADALAMIENGAAFDAVLADVLLPGGMNGLQLARTLGARFPAIPVLLATGFGYAAEIAKLSGVRSIMKPYSAEQVATLLAEIIGAARAPKGA